MNEERIGQNNLSPEDLLLIAYSLFDTNCIDRDSLTKIALALKCPSDDIAHRVFEKYGQ